MGLRRRVFCFVFFRKGVHRFDNSKRYPFKLGPLVWTKLNVLRPSVFANGPMGKKVNIGKIYNNTNNDKQPKKKNNKIKNGTIF